MIRFYIWCAIIFQIIGYIYGFFAENNDVLLFSGMLNMLSILMVIAWFVEDRK